MAPGLHLCPPYGTLRSSPSVFLEEHGSIENPSHAQGMQIKMTMKMLNKLQPGSVAALVLAASLGIPAVAQSSQQPAQVQTGATTSSAQPSSTDNSTYATGQPLTTKTNEGFWGHMNPFARKKWVNRQLNPVKDRLNELDQLSAKNANDIKDVDSRAQAGIHRAQSTADQADQQATVASNTANQAQSTAQQASAHTSQLNTTVSNLDQYEQVSDTEIRFRAGQTSLNAKAKDALDEVATQLQGQKGYLVEVQGYSRVGGQAGIQSSQRMADAVVRYLVTNHQIPVYRIHQVAMGKVKLETSDGAAPRGSVVHVTLVHNSLAAMNGQTPVGAQPTGATRQTN